MITLQWGAYEEMSCYGAEVPLAVPCDGCAEVSRAGMHLSLGCMPWPWGCTQSTGARAVAPV